MKKKLIEVFEELGLQPQQADGDNSDWVAYCPNGGDHKLEIDARRGFWYCSKCNDKGDEADIRILNWQAEKRMQSLDQKNLSYFVKALDGKVPMTKEIWAWWMNRY